MDESTAHQFSEDVVSGLTRVRGSLTSSVWSEYDIEKFSFFDEASLTNDEER